MTAWDPGTRHDASRQTPSPPEQSEWRRPVGRERAALDCRHQHPAGASREALRAPRARAELARWLAWPEFPGVFDGATAIVGRGTGETVDLGPSAFPFTAEHTVWNALVAQGGAA